MLYLSILPVDPKRFSKEGTGRSNTFDCLGLFSLLTALRITDSLTNQVSVKINQFFFSLHSQNNSPYTVKE